MSCEVTVAVTLGPEEDPLVLPSTCSDGLSWTKMVLPDWELRYTYAPPSIYVPGNVLLAAVRDSGAIPMTVSVEGTSFEDLENKKVELETALLAWPGLFQVDATDDNGTVTIAGPWESFPTLPRWGDVLPTVLGHYLWEATFSLPVNPTEDTSATVGAVPDTPAIPTTVSTTTTTATLSWLEVDGATSYRLGISEDGVTGWASVYIGSELEYTDSGLDPDTDNYYRVTAFNDNGPSLPSPVRLVTTDAVPGTEPGTPSTPSASAVSETTADLTVSEVYTATFYGWQRSDVSGTTGFVDLADTDPSISDSGLTAETDYWYRVRASNDYGDSAYSAALAITTDAVPSTEPEEPAMLTLDAQTPTSNTLRITPVATATEYRTERSTVVPGAPPWTTVHVGSNLVVPDTGRTPETDYYYRHVAINAAGESPYSDTLMVTTPSSSANVQPFSALQLRTRSGVDIHPPDRGTTYSNVSAVMAAVARLGVTWVRGMATPGNSQSDEYAAAIRAAGLKWCMTTSPTKSAPTYAQTVAKVRAIGNNPDYALTCMALEGLNEPNNGAAVPSGYGGDWADWAVDISKAISITAQEFPSTLANAERVGPALHQLRVKESNGEHYQRIVNRGIKTWTDTAGLHAYPNGLKPTNNMAERIDFIRDAYGVNYPIRMTEFGYTTTSGTASGNTTTKKAMGIYGPRAYLQLCIGLGIPMSWYEMVDDPDGTGNSIQAHYGMVNTPSLSPGTWTDKAVVASVGDLLNALEDPDGTAPYTPDMVEVAVNTTATDIVWYCTATKAQSDAGTATIWMFRDVNVATGVTDQTIATKPVTIVDRAGSRSYDVDGTTRKVNLR